MLSVNPGPAGLMLGKEKGSGFARCQGGASHKQRQSRGKQSERNHLAGEERFNLCGGDLSALVRGLPVGFTPTQLLSRKRKFKKRDILGSFGEIHWKKISLLSSPSS